MLARVLVSPAFLFRIEQAPPGKAARPGQRLGAGHPAQLLPLVVARRTTSCAGSPRPAGCATRRSWPSRPGGCSRTTASAALAIEFGTQWIHVRGFDELKEKNEKLFPTFDAELRKAIYEESILFFQDLFQSDRPVTQILDADYTFLNETLAKHYGIPGVTGPQWRRVEGVRKYGRGGILGLASVQAKQSGASRTSPVLRGNWVVETLLGEKLPRPPANVPQAARRGRRRRRPDDAAAGREARQRRRRAPSAIVRIDPFGFALEQLRRDRPAARQGPRRPADRRPGEAARTAPSSTASTACGPTC